jgi:hypothetical protein
MYVCMYVHVLCVITHVLVCSREKGQSVSLFVCVCVCLCVCTSEKTG